MGKMHQFLGVSQLTGHGGKLWRALFGEFLGVLFIVLIGCGSTVKGWTAGDAPSMFRIAFAFGIAVASVVNFVGHISGGHVNPAITIALLVVRRIELIPAILYVAAQCLGGIVGALILREITPEDMREAIGQATLDPKLNSGQGFAVELLITALLLFVVFGLTDEYRDDIKGSIPLSIGLAVTGCHLLAIKFTGCGMNPARVLGPAVATGVWDNHWMYWSGECVGAVLAAILYQIMFAASPPGDDYSIFGRIFRKVHSGSSTDFITGMESKEIAPSNVTVERIRKPQEEP